MWWWQSGVRGRVMADQRQRFSTTWRWQLRKESCKLYRFWQLDYMLYAHLVNRLCSDISSFRTLLSISKFLLKQSSHFDTQNQEDLYFKEQNKWIAKRDKKKSFSILFRQVCYKQIQMECVIWNLPKHKGNWNFVWFLLT